MDKIWLKSYPAGIPETISPEKYTHMGALFDDVTQQYAKHPAFWSFGKTLSFEALSEKVEACAWVFQEKLHLKKGDRLGIMLPNLLQYPVVLWAALKLGLVVVNINPLYTPRELGLQLQDAGCVALVVLDLFFPSVKAVWSETALQNVVITHVGDLLGLKGFAIDWGMRLTGKAPFSCFLPKGAWRFSGLLKAFRGQKVVYPDINSQDLAFLQYTGGTTGIPKGAMLSHRNMVANILQAEAWFGKNIQLGKEIIITALPLYHIFALMANAMLFFKFGAMNVLITQPRDIPRFVKILSQLRFTAITGVNTLFNALLQNKAFHDLNFSSLKLCFGGGMAVQRSVGRQWQRITGVPLLQAYGLTEASPAVAINPVSLLDFSESVGLPIPSTEIKIVNDQAREQAIGETGELWVKGPQVMQGYWQNPSETDLVLKPDAWLRTGDMASVDHRGFIRILDRKKELILVSGFNVYPNEVEGVISMHPGVKEVGVAATLNTQGEEQVTAYIVKNDSSLTEKELITHCRKFLTAYKVPKKVFFRDSLPKTPVGKVLRRALAETS